MSWNVTLPRMVTWALFESIPSRKRFYYYNTHFAHRREDEDARLKSTEVILARIAKLPQNVPFLMTGDYNANAGGPVQQKFLTVLTDAWTATTKRIGPEGTFHGFSGKPREGRIDWILYRGPWKALEVETVTHNENGRYPSDHFPVFARLELIASRNVARPLLKSHAWFRPSSYSPSRDRQGAVREVSDRDIRLKCILISRASPVRS